MLTSFARNIASVLSTTLLNDYQDPPSNQSSSNLLKRIQETQFSLDIGRTQPESPEISSNTSFNRYPRYTRESSSNEGKQTFQNTFLTNTPQYSKYYNSEAYKPYEFASNRDARISYNQLNVETPGDVNGGTKDNSIDVNIKTAPLHYSNQYHQPPGFRYKSEPIHQLSNANHYAQFDPQPNYHHLSPQTPVNSQESSRTEGLNPNDENENTQIARITRKPFNLNYHSPFTGPYYPFHQYPGFYSHHRPIEGENQPVNPSSGQDESNPPRLINDQNQGQTAIGGYDYSPRFHHKQPYYDGFYHGFPGFYPGPFNESFYRGNVEQGGSNGTYSPYDPYNPFYFHGSKFGPYVPYNQPYYPNFNGQRRPVEPQNPPENQGHPEQITSPENVQGDVNSTGYHPPYGGYPYGFPPYGPYYGGFNFHSYPLVPFHGLPYRFGFHNYLFPGIKPVPYLNFYPSNYPLVHSYPFGGYYPYYKRPAVTEKPEQTEKATDENHKTGSAPNSEAEMLSESKSEEVRSLISNGYKKRASFGLMTKERNKVESDRSLNQLS